MDLLVEVTAVLDDSCVLFNIVLDGFIKLKGMAHDYNVIKYSITYFNDSNNLDRMRYIVGMILEGLVRTSNFKIISEGISGFNEVLLPEKVPTYKLTYVVHSVSIEELLTAGDVLIQNTTMVAWGPSSRRIGRALATGKDDEQDNE